ncbi:hypothetical protein P7C70_g94, partial [Phenoliferia sp. Uapishka_3]
MSGSRGEANFVWKCTLCKRESSISALFEVLGGGRVTPPLMLDKDFDNGFNRANALYTLEDSDAQKYATLAVVECRGCEVIEFDPKGVWSCKGAESNTKFTEVELSLDEEDGWTDYDEKSAQPVSVTEMTSKIERA